MTHCFSKTGDKSWCVSVQVLKITLPLLPHWSQQMRPVTAEKSLPFVFEAKQVLQRAKGNGRTSNSPTKKTGINLSSETRLPGFGKLLLTEGRQLSLRGRFQQGVVGSRLHFTVPAGNNTEGSVRGLGFVAVICYSDTYAASCWQVEMCIISYLQEVNIEFVKLGVPNSFTIEFTICKKSLTLNLRCHDELAHYPRP